MEKLKNFCLFLKSNVKCDEKIGDIIDNYIKETDETPMQCQFKLNMFLMYIRNVITLHKTFHQWCIKHIRDLKEGDLSLPEYAQRIWDDAEIVLDSGDDTPPHLMTDNGFMILYCQMVTVMMGITDINFEKPVDNSLDDIFRDFRRKFIDRESFIKFFAYIEYFIDCALIQ